MAERKAIVHVAGTLSELPAGDTIAGVAPSSQGVTNGNSHDHNGGDGGQIAYSSLSGLPTISKEISFTIPGTQTVGSGTMRWYLDGNFTIATVIASVSTAPTGASLIFDVNKNGTTIFSTQGNRPTITASAFTDLASTPDVTSLASGDYLTVDVDQIGSTVAGADAIVRIRVT